MFGIYNSGRVFAWNRRGYFQPECDRAGHSGTVPATLAPWKAELVFRGERVAVLGGEHRHRDTVVIRFPSVEAVDAWYQSDAYQALIPLRLAAADVDLISFAET